MDFTERCSQYGMYGYMVGIFKLDGNMMIGCWSEIKSGTLESAYEMLLTGVGGHMAGDWILSLQCS